jgi:hypothetical protein
MDPRVQHVAIYLGVLAAIWSILANSIKIGEWVVTRIDDQKKKKNRGNRSEGIDGRPFLKKITKVLQPTVPVYS